MLAGTSPRLHFLVIAYFGLIKLACEQALWGTLAAGWEKEGALTTTSLEFHSTSNSPVAPPRLSCQISANQHEAETSVNVKNIEKHVPRVMTSLLMSSLPISILH